MSQDLHRHELDHPGFQTRVDQADNRHSRRQFGVAQDVFDPGAKRQYRFEIWERSQDAPRRLPGQRDIDIVWVADAVRPDADIQIVNFSAQCRRPDVRVLAIA